MTIIYGADLIKQINDRKQVLRTKGETCSHIRKTIYEGERISQHNDTTTFNKSNGPNKATTADRKQRGG